MLKMAEMESIFDWLSFGLIMMVVLAVIFILREYGHNMMCLDLCNGDKARAKKLHDGYHEDGFI
jgi:hypothetical protein